MAILNDESMWLNDNRVEYQKYSINNITHYYWDYYNVKTTTTATRYKSNYVSSSGYKIFNLPCKLYHPWVWDFSGTTSTYPLNSTSTYYSADEISGFDVFATSSAAREAFQFNYAEDYGSNQVKLYYNYRYYISSIPGKTTYSQGTTYYGQVSSTSNSTYPTNGKSDNYWYVKSSTTSITQEKGSLIETFKAKDGEYPDNGVKDGYWYVKIS